MKFNSCIKKVTKNNRGITLIALVITIIVILILAGVVIVTLTGDNGVLQKAKQSVEATDKGNLKEAVDLAYLDYSSQLKKENDLEYYLNKIDGASIEKLGEGLWVVSRKSAKLTVNNSGKIFDDQVITWSTGSPECPKFEKTGNIWEWYIYTPEQLKFLECFVNNGNNLTGKTNLTNIVIDAGYNPEDVCMTIETKIFLMNDLDLGAKPSGNNWETEENEAVKWTPIGTNRDDVINKFGKFEGNNHTIQGVYVNTGIFAGIFGNSNTVKNLTISNSYIKGTICVGGIAGAVRSGEIENCHNINTTVVGSEYDVGGVVGQYQCIVRNCTNSGSISAARILGGIVGNAYDSNSQLIQCTNKGSVTGKDGNIGGICGGLSGSLEKCVNTGDVTCESGGTKKDNLGGIVGTTFTNSTIRIANCYNTGKVTEYRDNSVGIGGIIGWISISGSRGEIKNNYSIGIIDIKGNNCSGIGGAIGRAGGDLFVLRYNFYEKGKSNVSLGNLDQGLEASEMKTEQFVNQLNSEQNPAVWELGNGNNGYPTLK